MIVISTLPSVKGRRFVLVRCGCGKDFSIRHDQLKSRPNASCGCSKLSKLTDRRRAINFRYAELKNSKKEFNLSLSEVEFLIFANCYYCGEAPNREIKAKVSNKITTQVTGIDRYTNGLGYISGNCVSCCQTCNIMKKDMDGNVFIKFIEKLYNNTRKNTKF